MTPLAPGRLLTLSSVLISCAAVSACGAPGGSTTGSGGPPSSDGQKQATVTDTQPGGPCEEASSSLLSQVEDQLASKDTELSSAQVIQSDQPIEGGPDEPYFLSAKATVGGGTPQVATWVLEDERSGSVVPVDAFAKLVSETQDPVDLKPYAQVGQDEAFKASKMCANQADALRIRRENQKEAAARQDEAAKQRERQQQAAAERSQKGQQSGGSGGQ